MKAALAVAAITLAACGQPAPRPPEKVVGLEEALAAGDAAGVADRFAEDGVVVLIPDGRASGRAAIEEAATELRARFDDLQVTIGRTWSDGDVRVIEFVVSGERAGQPIGAVGAAVVAFDDAGLATAARVYLDLVTVVGQVDPSRLPETARVRAPVAAPPAGTAAVAASGTATERANLAAAEQIWARLDAHDAAGVLAASSDDYVYDDFSGPAPLDRAGTEALVDGFVHLVGDFTIVEKHIFFAAGDDVVTESVEHMTFQGREVTLHGLDVKHFADGQVVREWQYANGAEVLSALLGLPIPTLP